MDSLDLNFAACVLLWLLLLSPIYSKSIDSSSTSSTIWITKTVEETTTVDCSTTTISSANTPYSTIYTSRCDVISGCSTVQMTSYAISDYPADTTKSPSTFIPLASISSSSTAPGTFLSTSGTSLTSTIIPSSNTGILGSPTTETSSSFLGLPTQPEFVLPGASAVTIGGIPVSLGLSGTVVIGTNTLTLLSGSSAAEVFTIGSQAVTIWSTGFEVFPPPHTLSLPTTTVELTVVPGGTPVTIGTVPISLGEGGTLVIAGSTQVVSATGAEKITINGEIITASPGGFVVEPLTLTTATLTAVMTGQVPFVFSSSFISIPSLTSWSETTTELPGQTTPTILPIWPCLTLCGSEYNGIMIIPKSPLPPSSFVIPPPFTFSPLTIGSDGLPTVVPKASPSLSVTLPTVPITATTDSISSTMTVVPPRFSTEAATNTLWTSNTWLTTSVGGSPTIVPVLVGCPGCGGLHGGIILWNLPELPRVSFQLPGFPGLPKFHLPCIKIFGIKISGDCDTPPTTDGDNSNDPTKTGEPKESPTTQSRPSTVASSTPATSSASVSSVCSSTAVPSCTRICNLATQSDGVVATSCAAAVCQTITACSATPTTSTTYTSEWICAPTCSACAGDFRSSASVTIPSSTPSGLAKRVLPGPTNPENEEIRFKWFTDTMDSIQTLPHDEIEYSPNHPEGLSSSLINPLSSINGIAGTEGEMAGVDGIYGCAVVVVATPEAIWLSHIWQTSFTDALFQKDVIEFMFEGAKNRGRPGLQNYIDDPEIHPFSPSKQPVVLIIGARDRAKREVNAPRYPNMFKEMEVKLAEKFPQSPIQSFNYDPAETRGQLRSRWGKVLVQYDPKHPDCKGVLRPTIRVWVQGDVVLDAPFYNYASQGQVAQRRGDTSNNVCPLFWGQSVPPIEITATYSTSATSSVFATYTGTTTLLTSTIQGSSATSSQATTFSTSVVISSAARSSLFCLPSTGPVSVPTGLPQNQIAGNIKQMCAAIDTNSQALKGCDNQYHNGVLLSVDCNGAGKAFGGLYATTGMSFQYLGITAWLNVSLVEGKSFIVNSSTCNSAFSTVLNNCPPLANGGLFQPLNKFGGAVSILDGAGGTANFNILLVPANTPGQGGVPGCAYAIASNLKNNALCAADYCNCGGTVAPLLTSTISGSITFNCAYSTQPAIATCPPPPNVISAAPTQTTLTAAFPSGYPTGSRTDHCDCNEDGCTPESPPCCANGSCPGRPTQSSHRVRAFPTSTICSCNEISCTSDSPPCCANSSCGI